MNSSDLRDLVGKGAFITEPWPERGATIEKKYPIIILNIVYIGNESIRVTYLTREGSIDTFVTGAKGFETRYDFF